MSEAGNPSDNTTLTAVLERLRAEGYTEDFYVVEGGMLRCARCRSTMPASEMEVHEIRRLEGASDPSDMAAVLAITCPSCGVRGTAVVRFGPEADAADAEVLLALQDQRGT